MGQCGCGNFSGDFKFPGPDGITYVLQVYPPCSYCNTPAGVIIYAMNEEDCDTWDVGSIPEIKIQDIGSFFSVAHPEGVMKSIIEGLECYLEEGVGNEFRSAVFRSIKDNKKLYEDEG